MALHEFLISSSGHNYTNTEIGMAMTTASFNTALHAGVIGIEANVDAMDIIAEKLAEKAEAYIGNQLFVVRHGHANVSKPDDYLPDHQGSKFEDRFFPAGQLAEGSELQIVKHAGLAYAAREIGATSLTSITISDWSRDASHVGDLLLSFPQRYKPLELGPTPSLLGQLKSWVTPPVNPMHKDHAHYLKRLGLNNNFPEPFIIHYKA